MALASVVGRDRPEVGASVDAAVPGRQGRAGCEVRWSSELELTVSAGRDRAGERVPVSAGDELALSWRDLGEVRTRRYELVAVTEGTDPTWRLEPLGPAEAGNRRNAERVGMEVPVGLHLSDGLLVGTTVDLSLTGGRAVFPGDSPGARPRVLPAPGEQVAVTIALGDGRLELRAETVSVGLLTGGRRDLRFAVVELDDAGRERLRTAVEGTRV